MLAMGWPVMCCREHAIEGLSSREGGKTVEEAEAEVAEVDAEQWRALNTHKLTWIPVGERLPERNEIVLAFDQGGVTVGSYSPMLEDWWTLQVDRMAPGAVVTHWMPLPEPPEVM